MRPAPDAVADPAPPSIVLSTPGNTMTNATLEFLQKRRSAKAMLLAAPGPTPAELETILTAAPPACPTTRSWCRGASSSSRARRAPRFGEVLAQACPAEEKEPPSPVRLETERGRLLRAPTVVGVDLARRRRRRARPRSEQLLSCGAACLQSVPRRQRAGLRHLLDHRVVLLQPARAARRSASPPTSASPASSTSAPPASGSPTATAPHLPTSSRAGSAEPIRTDTRRQQSHVLRRHREQAWPEARSVQGADGAAADRLDLAPSAMTASPTSRPTASSTRSASGRTTSCSAPAA